MNQFTIIAAWISLFLLLALCVSYLFLYIRHKHRHLFARFQEMKAELSALRIKQIEPLCERVLKLYALREIESQGLCQASIAIPPRFTSQFGEDLLIFDFFKNGPLGFFVEAGAYDGEFASNTLLLESLGWSGLLVEPHPEMAARCRHTRPNSIVEEAALGPANASGFVEFTCADDPDGGAALSFVEGEAVHLDRCAREQCRLHKIRVPYRPLNELLDPLTDRVDFLSLDVEGMEISVLQGFDLQRFRPRMILLEMQNDNRDIAVSAYLEKAGYRPMAARGCNAFFLASGEATRFEEILGHETGGLGFSIS
jgi:FkbM family methyltransferase